MPVDRGGRHSIIPAELDPWFLKPRASGGRTDSRRGIFVDVYSTANIWSTDRAEFSQLALDAGHYNALHKVLLGRKENYQRGYNHHDRGRKQEVLKNLGNRIRILLEETYAH